MINYSELQILEAHVHSTVALEMWNGTITGAPHAGVATLG